MAIGEFVRGIIQGELKDVISYNMEKISKTIFQNHNIGQVGISNDWLWEKMFY